MTTPVEKSTNPSTNTAAQTVGGPPAPHQIATGHEGTVRDQIDSYLQHTVKPGIARYAYVGNID